MNESIFNDTDGYIKSILFALDYVAEYQKNGGGFDPFKILTDTDDKKSKLNRESLAFLHEIENVIDEYRKTTKKCI